MSAEKGHASAEAIRRLEWGARSYQDFALGLALLLFAAAGARTAWVTRPIAWAYTGWQDPRELKVLTPLKR